MAESVPGSVENVTACPACGGWKKVSQSRDSRGRQTCRSSARQVRGGARWRARVPPSPRATRRPPPRALVLIVLLVAAAAPAAAKRRRRMTCAT